jgi:hypothetical protein
MTQSRRVASELSHAFSCQIDYSSGPVQARLVVCARHHSLPSATITTIDKPLVARITPQIRYSLADFALSPLVRVKRGYRKLQAYAPKGIASQGRSGCRCAECGPLLLPFVPRCQSRAPAWVQKGPSASYRRFVIVSDKQSSDRA